MFFKVTMSRLNCSALWKTGGIRRSSNDMLLGPKDTEKHLSFFVALSADLHTSPRLNCCPKCCVEFPPGKLQVQHAMRDVQHKSQKTNKKTPLPFNVLDNQHRDLCFHSLALLLQDLLSFFLRTKSKMISLHCVMDNNVIPQRQAMHLCLKRHCRRHWSCFTSRGEISPFQCGEITVYR